MAAEFPLAKFYFKVSIAGDSIKCYEVTGLDQEADVLEYRFGSSTEFVTMKRLGMLKTSKVVFKKAIFKQDGFINDLWKQVYSKEYYSHTTNQKDMIVQLLDEKGEVVVSWKIKRAVPTKFTGASLKADANEVAMEEIEFVHEGIETDFV